AEAAAASPGDRTGRPRPSLARGRGTLSLPDARRLPALREPRGLARAQPGAPLARPEGHAAGVPRYARDHALARLREGRERGASSASPPARPDARVAAAIRARPRARHTRRAEAVRRP